MIRHYWEISVLFMILPLVYFCFEEQREIYSDRKNRVQVRFQVLVFELKSDFKFLSYFATVLLLSNLQLVLDQGERRGSWTWVESWLLI